MTEPQPNVVAAQLWPKPSVWPTSWAERYARRSSTRRSSSTAPSASKAASQAASGAPQAAQAAGDGRARFHHWRAVVRRRCESMRATACRISPVRGSARNSPIDQARSARWIHSMPE